jgi:hypothetical protein
MPSSLSKTTLPLYRNAIDWTWFDAEFPAPDVYVETIFKWSPERIRELQNARFLETMKAGWNNGFYSTRWKEAGLEPGDIASIDDIHKLPMFNSDDIKVSHRASPPFGDITGIDHRDELTRNPLKMQTSGGTTARRARPCSGRWNGIERAPGGPQPLHPGRPPGAGHADPLDVLARQPRLGPLPRVVTTISASCR